MSQTSTMFIFAIKTASLAPELQVSMGPSPHLLFFWVHNSVIMTRINSLYGSKTSPVIVCMQYNENNIRIISLYGSQPSSVVYACKTATLWPELQVSIAPSPHLWFFCIQNSVFSIRIAGLYGSQPSSVVFFCIHNSFIMTRINSL